MEGATGGYGISVETFSTFQGISIYPKFRYSAYLENFQTIGDALFRSLIGLGTVMWEQ
jgi:hypothetical protein